MKKIKRYKEFLENAVATASSTSGMGAVSAAQPGALAGTTGTEGSGDVGFVFKKEKRKKGNPSQVSDMRDLAPAKGITKVEDIKESLIVRKRDPKYDSEVVDIINDCLSELYDEEFELNRIDYKKNTETVDLDDDTYGYVKTEELVVSVYKQIKKSWTGNITIKKYFDKNGITKTDVSTLRASGKKLSDEEQRLSDLSEEIGNKLINLLDYKDGFLSVDWLVSGSAMPFGTERNINCNIHFELNNMVLEDEIHKNI